MAILDQIKKIISKVHAPKKFTGATSNDPGTRLEQGRASGAGAAGLGSSAGPGS